MESPLADEMSQIFRAAATRGDGEVADYIPELASANPARTGLCVTSIEGHEYAYGDVDEPFTIQSISKVFSYALALQTRGLAEVDVRIDVEPSGEAFNVLSLDQVSRRPRNAMINAGAITASALLPGDSPETQIRSLQDYLARFLDHPVIIDERVYASEAATGHRNLAIAHLLRSVDMIDGDPVAVADVYFRQCSIQVTARDLARLAATLANGGVHLVTGETLVPRDVLRRVLSVMASCGMYDGAGHWMTEVGLPAKSGVSGGILAVLPQQFGVATYAPPLNEHGNSVRGVAICRELSQHYGLHVFEPRLGRLHTVRVEEEAADGARVVRLVVQGDLNGVGIEALLWRIVREPSTTRVVVVDLRSADQITAYARQALRGLVMTFAADGRELRFQDPQGLLGDV